MPALEGVLACGCFNQPETPIRERDQARREGSRRPRRARTSSERMCPGVLAPFRLPDATSSTEGGVVSTSMSLPWLSDPGSPPTWSSNSMGDPAPSTPCPDETGACKREPTSRGTPAEARSQAIGDRSRDRRRDRQSLFFGPILPHEGSTWRRRHKVARGNLTRQRRSKLDRQRYRYGSGGGKGGGRCSRPGSKTSNVEHLWLPAQYARFSLSPGRTPSKAPEPARDELPHHGGMLRDDVPGPGAGNPEMHPQPPKTAPRVAPPAHGDPTRPSPCPRISSANGVRNPLNPRSIDPGVVPRELQRLGRPTATYREDRAFVDHERVLVLEVQIGGPVPGRDRVGEVEHARVPSRQVGGDRVRPGVQPQQGVALDSLPTWPVATTGKKTNKQTKQT